MLRDRDVLDEAEAAEGALGLYLHDMRLDTRIGEDAQAGALEAEAGERDGGGDVDVPGIERRALAHRAVEQQEGLAEPGQLAQALGRRAGPGARVLADRDRHPLEDRKSTRL